MTSGFTILFFNISGGEIFIILLIVFLIFGPSKIPEVARSLGRMMNEVKKASSDISREFRKETTAIERDFSKTASDVKSKMHGLADDPMQNTEFSGSDNPEAEIPDVYLKNNHEEPEADDISTETDDKCIEETGRKTGEDIQ